MRHIFIVNSISGQGKAKSFAPIIEKTCQDKNLDYIIEFTQGPKDAQRLASKYSDKDSIIYSVGGDGTLFEVVNGVSEDATVAIIPLGSGNDFYRLIGKEKDFKKILIDTIDAPVKMIDIATCNDYKWINVTSFGIDAKINACASNWIRNQTFSKGPAYILAILKNVIKLKSEYYKIKIDDQVIEGEFYIVAVMNGRYYGNGIKACPSADIQDGYLDVCLVEKCPAYHTYPFLMKYLRGKHTNSKLFRQIKAQNVIIDCIKEVECESDGENSTTTHVEINIKKGALKLKAPAYLNIIR